MRVLVADEYYYAFDNYGDVALFDAMVQQLQRLWPEVQIDVVTCAPDDLASRWPTIGALRPEWYHDWLGFHYQRFLGAWEGRLPDPVSATVRRVERVVRRRWPVATRAILSSKGRLRRHDLAGARRFEDAILRADLVVVTGGGHFIEGYESHALNLLRVLGFAAAHGRTTAMFSQGIPRVTHPELSAWMRAVLPGVDHIAVREKRDALPVLGALGVDADRVMVTGDDAIAAAHARAADATREGLGVNVRRARYAAVDDEVIEMLRGVVHGAARRHATPLIPVPISAIPSESDAAAIRVLLAGYDDESDGGETIDSMQAAIAQAGRCRLMVTGSYHAAVFALAQGIPAIGLARSPYYVHKFGGLADQFGAGCEVIHVDGGNVRAGLASAIDRLWEEAAALRKPLLEAAARQVGSSRASYDRVGALVDSGGALMTASRTA